MALVRKSQLVALFMAMFLTIFIWFNVYHHQLHNNTGSTIDVSYFVNGYKHLTEQDSQRRSAPHSSSSLVTGVPIVKSLSKTFKPKVAIVFAGSARSFVCPKVHWSIRQNFIDALDADPHVFVRLAIDDNYNTMTGSGVLTTPKYRDNEIEETLKVLNPRDVEYYTLKDQIAHMKREFPSEKHRIFRENDNRRYSMFFHRCMSYKLVQRFEENNSMRFDWVILARLDAAWVHPIYPISTYADDRVWITESGFVLFNDQFMMIPRKYSDYLYNLETKVTKNVYCLGGPDVEVWKCNRTHLAVIGVEAQEINKRLEYCCPDLLKEIAAVDEPGAKRKVFDQESNTMGYSETIHFRHLKEGRIAVAFANLPVFLVRLWPNGECHEECERLWFNAKEYNAMGNMSVYPYFKPDVWPDVRLRGINIGLHSLCKSLFGARGGHNYDPLRAIDMHTRGGFNVRNFTQNPIDYSVPVKELAMNHVIPSSQIINPADFSIWRIRPFFNMMECLTWNFQHKNHSWESCRDRSKKKGGLIDDAGQLFLLNIVKPQGIKYGLDYLSTLTQYPPVPELTRVMMMDRDAFGWEFSQVLCLTITRTIYMPGKGSFVDGIGKFLPCEFQKDNGLYSEQLFLSPQPRVKGSNPHSYIGRLQLALEPHLCIQRSPYEYGPYATQPINDNLRIGPCEYAHLRMPMQNFEFEERPVLF